MADLKQSGYKIALTAVVFAGTRTLVSLGIDEWTDLSNEIDNTADGYLFADWKLELGSAAFAGLDSEVAFYIVPSIDGTTDPDWTGDGTADLQEQDIYFAGAFKTSIATTAQDLALRKIELPPGKFKIGVRNKSPVALAATGNTLSYRPWQYSYV